MSDTRAEIDYYRAIEDLFATLRGVPHILSPKDFQLLRQWWREAVPLTAVTGGISEVFARRRDRGDDDPVVSLSYCRHAVRRHAKRLAAMHVGEAASRPGAESGAPAAEAIAALAAELGRIADGVRGLHPAVADVIAGIAQQVARTPDLPAALAEEQLYALESALLAGCWRALEEHERADIEQACGGDLDGADEATRRRSRRALRDREVRRRLGLPRLELA